MKLKIIHYHFDTREEDEAAAWNALNEKLKDGRHQHSSHNGYPQYFTKSYEEEIEIETEHIFSDQFTEKGGKGRRLFDWYLQYRLEIKSIKQGHYVEDLTELNKLRTGTFACGYCGKTGTGEFCDRCLGSEYLETDQLHLLRLYSKIEYMPKRPELTEEEAAWLIPAWEEAQGLGKIATDRARLAVWRMKVDKLVPDAEEEALGVVETAKFKRDCYTWLLDHKYKDLYNTIIYKDGVLTFGWREKVDEGLKELLKDAPFKWKIKEPS